VRRAFIGYGALGRYIAAMIDEASPEAPRSPSDAAYFDDRLHQTGAHQSFPFEAHSDEQFRHCEFYVCLGYKHLARKKQIVDQLIALGRSVPHYIHPSSYVHPSVQIGHGSMIYPGCSIDRNTVIGNAVWIANASVIAHDCVIGDCCWFGASVTVSGQVTIAESTFVGSGSTLANDVKVGARATIGLATAVTRSIGDGVSVIGNPMRILDQPLRLV
jgi:sugar O-acyltransferase (sialic acid O-acetyltransferase NeuD family)